MSETSEAAAKKPRARKTATKTTAEKTAAKAAKPTDSRAVAETPPQPSDLAASSVPAAQTPAPKAPRKRPAAKKTGGEAGKKPAAGQGEGEGTPAVSTETAAADQPAAPRAAARRPGGRTRAAKSGETAAKPAAAETGAAPEQTPTGLVSPAIPVNPADFPVEAPPRPEPESDAATAEAGKTRRAKSRSAARPRKKKPAAPAEPGGQVDGLADGLADTVAALPEKSAATETAAPDNAGLTGEVDGSDAAAENARPQSDEEQPREKSRRSRSRRGRRKSAAARAAAQERQAGGQTAPAETPAQAAGEPGAAPLSEAGDAVGIETGGSEDQPKAQTEAPPPRSKDGGKKGGAAGKSDKETEKNRQKRKMFVSVLPGEQVEVVLTAEGQVQEYYVEMLHQAKIKGNIYKGVIHNVDANLQAAFVSYGAAKNGFLQIDEVHPEYYLAPHESSGGHKYPLIQKVLKPGQEILIQVVKEPSGSKGAFLTSYLSLAGRFLVLTPGREQIGVSRKLDSEEERARLRELLSGLNPGEGLGVIVRTVSNGATKTSLQKDLQLLKRLWKDVRKKGSTEPAPCLIYQELGLDTRAVRDYLTDEVIEVWVDDEDMAEQIRELAGMLFPRKTDMVQVHKDMDSSLFERFGLKKQLDQVHSREVTLPSGGRLVFDHTEALMAIDINSGRSAGKSNFEDTAFKTNLEAAQHIPLQLRLRDIGGQIVIDFIEMRDRAHWREVEKAVRNGMKTDRARHDIGKISSFGLMEIVRQRLSSSAISTTIEPCPCCKGTGQRRNLEWQALQALRDISVKLRKQAAAAKSGNGGNGAVCYSGNAELILYLLNNKRERLSEMEKNSGLRLELKPE